MKNSFRRVGLRRFSAALAVVSAILLAGAANAADIKERSLKIAFVNIKEHPHGLGAQKFADIVAEKSGGKIKAKLFGGGTLGGDLAVVSSLQGGTVDMTMVVPGTVSGNIKEFSIFDFPLLFNSYEEADAVLDGPVGQKLLARLPEKGLIGLGYWDHGYRNLTNNRRAVAKLEDIQGLKIRVIQIPIVIDTFNALGANAVPMPLPEVYTALETGAVDGQENPNALIESSKYQEVQKYLSTTQHIYNPLVVLFSRKTWDKLSEDERRILQEAATEATAYERKVSRETNVAALEKLKKDGMNITEFPPAETERMREKLKPVVDKYSYEIGEPLVKEMLAEIEKVRAHQ